MEIGIQKARESNWRLDSGLRRNVGYAFAAILRFVYSISPPAPSSFPRRRESITWVAATDRPLCSYRPAAILRFVYSIKPPAFTSSLMNSG